MNQKNRPEGFKLKLKLPLPNNNSPNKKAKHVLTNDTLRANVSSQATEQVTSMISTALPGDILQGVRQQLNQKAIQSSAGQNQSTPVNQVKICQTQNQAIDDNIALTDVQRTCDDNSSKPQDQRQNQNIAQTETQTECCQDAQDKVTASTLGQTQVGQNSPQQKVVELEATLSQETLSQDQSQLIVEQATQEVVLGMVNVIDRACGGEVNSSLRTGQGGGGNNLGGSVQQRLGLGTLQNCNGNIGVLNQIAVPDFSSGDDKHEDKEFAECEKCLKWRLVDKAMVGKISRTNWECGKCDEACEYCKLQQCSCRETKPNRVCHKGYVVGGGRCPKGFERIVRFRNGSGNPWILFKGNCPVCGKSSPNLDRHQKVAKFLERHQRSCGAFNDLTVLDFPFQMDKKSIMESKQKQILQQVEEKQNDSIGALPPRIKCVGILPLVQNSSSEEQYKMRKNVTLIRSSENFKPKRAKPDDDDQDQQPQQKRQKVLIVSRCFQSDTSKNKSLDKTPSSSKKSVQEQIITPKTQHRQSQRKSQLNQQYQEASIPAQFLTPADNVPPSQPSEELSLEQLGQQVLRGSSHQTHSQQYQEFATHGLPPLQQVMQQEERYNQIASELRNLARSVFKDPVPQLIQQNMNQNELVQVVKQLYSQEQYLNHQIQLFLQNKVQQEQLWQLLSDQGKHLWTRAPAGRISFQRSIFILFQIIPVVVKKQQEVIRQLKHSAGKSVASPRSSQDQINQQIFAKQLQGNNSAVLTEESIPQAQSQQQVAVLPPVKSTPAQPQESQVLQSKQQGNGDQQQCQQTELQAQKLLQEEQVQKQQQQVLAGDGSSSSEQGQQQLQQQSISPTKVQSDSGLHQQQHVSPAGASQEAQKSHQYQSSIPVPQAAAMIARFVSHSYEQGDEEKRSFLKWCCKVLREWQPDQTMFQAIQSMVKASKVLSNQCLESQVNIGVQCEVQNIKTQVVDEAAQKFDHRSNASQDLDVQKEDQQDKVVVIEQEVVSHQQADVEEEEDIPLTQVVQGQQDDCELDAGHRPMEVENNSEEVQNVQQPTEDLNGECALMEVDSKRITTENRQQLCQQQHTDIQKDVAQSNSELPEIVNAQQQQDYPKERKDNTSVQHHTTHQTDQLQQQSLRNFSRGIAIENCPASKNCGLQTQQGQPYDNKLCQQRSGVQESQNQQCTHTSAKEQSAHDNTQQHMQHSSTQKASDQQINDTFKISQQEQNRESGKESSGYQIVFQTVVNGIVRNIKGSSYPQVEHSTLSKGNESPLTTMRTVDSACLNGSDIQVVLTMHENNGHEQIAINNSNSNDDNNNNNNSVQPQVGSGVGEKPFYEMDYVAMD